MMASLSFFLPIFVLCQCVSAMPMIGACGKTSLLCSFALGEFPKEYVRVPLSRFPWPLFVREGCHAASLGQG